MTAKTRSVAYCEIVPSYGYGKLTLTCTDVSGPSLMTYMFLHLTFDLVSSRARDCGLSDSTVDRLKKEFVGRFLC
jgi:hypothetical protein